MLRREFLGDGWDNMLVLAGGQGARALVRDAEPSGASLNFLRANETSRRSPQCIICPPPLLVKKMLFWILALTAIVGPAQDTGVVWFHPRVGVLGSWCHVWVY